MSVWGGAVRSSFWEVGHVGVEVEREGPFLGSPVASQPSGELPFPRQHGPRAFFLQHTRDADNSNPVLRWGEENQAQG